MKDTGKLTLSSPRRYAVVNRSQCMKIYWNQGRILEVRYHTTGSYEGPTHCWAWISPPYSPDWCVAWLKCSVLPVFVGHTSASEIIQSLFSMNMHDCRTLLSNWVQHQFSNNPPVEIRRLIVRDIHTSRAVQHTSSLTSISCIVTSCPNPKTMILQKIKFRTMVPSRLCMCYLTSAA